MMPTKLWAQEPYAVLSADSLTVTFYYDDQKTARGGIDIIGSNNYRENSPCRVATTAVFDASFADYRPTSTAFLFYNCSLLTTIDDIKNLKTDDVNRMSYMFYGCSSLKGIDLSGFKTDNVTDMAGMFYGCSSLTSLDVSSFNTENVTSMWSMFQNCSALTSLDVSNFKTDNLEGMAYMFRGCSSLTSLDVSGFNNGKVTQTTELFRDCSNLKNLKLNNFKTDNVIYMEYMFSGCSALTSLDLSSFKTDNVTDMNSMFDGCSKLTSLDVSGFNTANVTNMGGMFRNCSSLTSLDVSGFKTNNVKGMSGMFSSCSSLKSLDLSGFNTANVTGMNTMFYACSALESLDVSGFRTDKVTGMEEMFRKCSSLTTLDVSSFKTDNVTKMNYMFLDCSNLTTIYASSEWRTEEATETSGAYMFNGCTKLVGGNGTTYDANHTDYTYAHIDGGPSNPGYFTRSGDEPYTPTDPQPTTEWGEQLANGDAEKPWTNPDTGYDDMENNYKICAWNRVKGVNGWEPFPSTIEEEEGNTSNHVFVVHATLADTPNDDAGADVSAWDNQFWIQSPHAWKAGSKHRIKFRYKASKEVTTHTQVHKQTPTDYLIWHAIGNVTFTTDWQEFDKVVTWENDMDGGWSIAFNLNSEEKTATDFYFDDLSWYVYPEDSSESPEAAVSLINNGNLEGDDNSNYLYKNWLVDEKESPVSIQDGVGKDSSRGIKIETTAMVNDDWENQFWVYLNQPVSEGTKVRLSFDCRAEQEAEIRTESHAEPGDYIYWGTFRGNYTALDSWKTFSYEKVLDSDDSSDQKPMHSVAFSLNTFAEANTYYFDNIKFEVVMEDQCPKPTFTQSGNTVSIQSPFDATIYYTTDGTAPTTSSSVYTSPLQFTQEATIRAIAVVEGYETSPVATYLYSIEAEPYAVLEENTNANSMVDALSNRAAMAKAYTLKFYYDTKKTERNGMSVGPFKSSYDGELNVTTVNSEWFENRESITAAVFDDSFAECTTLTSTAYWFYGCSKLSSIVGLSNLKTDNVTQMSDMFLGCSSLTSIDLSNFKTGNVSGMGGMFYGCSSLTSLDLSMFNTQNVTSLRYMFYHCPGLTTLDLSNFNSANVTTIENMFDGCSNLKTIYVGEGWSTAKVEEGSGMFTYCVKLVGGAGTAYDDEHTDYTYAHIDGGPSNPGYFTNIADTVTVDDDIIPFADANVKAICVSNWDASGDGELSKTEAAAVTTIGTIFKGNTTIGSFNELKYFTGLESLSNSAFEKSTVTSLELPDGLREIGSDAFSQCRQLRSISIPATVSKMGSDRGMAEFWLCYSLETISVDENNKYYTAVDNVLFNKDMTKIIRYPAAKPDAAYEIPNTVSAINQNCFESCSYLMAVYIPASVNEMGYGAFQQCSKLIKVTISDGVTMIGEDAFRSCGSLERIHIPASVKQIGDERNSPENVFFWSGALMEITVDENNPYFMSEGGILYSRDKSIIVAYPPALTASEFAVPYGVQKISSCCFTGTKNLTSIQIPETVIAYGSAAINLSDNTLQSLTVMATTPATIEDYAFSDAAYSATLYVPVGTVQAYRNANGWKLFQNIVEQSNVPVDYSFDYNGVLTVGGSTTLADALSAAGGKDEVAKTITAIVWNSTASLTNSDLNGLSNPNMLIYVKDASLAPDRDNVVVGQTLIDTDGNYTYDDDGNPRVQWFAKNIMLSDVEEGNGSFYCPQAFTAEMISYTRNFQQQTEIGVCRGWETIALPFTVQTILHEKNGVISPFGNDASTKHFWLRQLIPGESLAQATAIEANTPYLISMPNSNDYPAEFNQAGRVTFSSQNAMVPVTSGNAASMRDSATNTMIVFYPTMQRIAQNEELYALNVGDSQAGYAEGSVFVAGLRDIRPFECYTWHHAHGPAPQFIPINELNGGATGIEDVGSLMSDGRGDNWYDLNGRRLQQKPTRKGVYIQNGRAVVIK